MFDALNQFIQDHAGATWVLPVVFALCLLDGFFPPLPSESVVVALAAVSASVGEPSLVLLFLVAAGGAFAGDNIAYTLGRNGGLRRLRHSKRFKMSTMLDWADQQLARRGAMIIIVARYIPVGRVAVNVTAGITRFHRGRFIACDLLAVTSWAAYSVAIGAVAGHWMEENPLLGAVLAITLAVILGAVVDRFLQRRGAAPREETDGAPTR
ncbi:DedA family protein [Ornithinicoccus hortensis]|uniref:Membrane protein DedA with SNARE-associated domain n=1 Tax=Ornithinicoccus hortensis TaxID=82346 RepID=A0A542YWG3_9MICO|nr:DedA family protein [Ornithinicoccus hortensis]TQL52439.1 membrane protein DedA with SNARE-associated domain [Ornithinicoccus hortensis]